MKKQHFVTDLTYSYLYDRPVSLTKREEWTVFLQDNLPEKTAKEFGRLKGVIKGILQYAELFVNSLVNHSSITKK